MSTHIEKQVQTQTAEEVVATTEMTETLKIAVVASPLHLGDETMCNLSATQQSLSESLGTKRNENIFKLVKKREETSFHTSKHKASSDSPKMHDVVRELQRISKKRSLSC